LCWPRPGRNPYETPEKVGLIDGVEHFDGRTLDDLVIHRGHADLPLPRVRLRDVDPPDRLRPVCAPPQLVGEVEEASLQVFSELLPRLAVGTRCGFPLEAEVGLPESGDVIDVVPERGEP